MTQRAMRTPHQAKLDVGFLIPLGSTSRKKGEVEKPLMALKAKVRDYAVKEFAALSGNILHLAAASCQHGRSLCGADVHPFAL